MSTTTDHRFGLNGRYPRIGRDPIGDAGPGYHWFPSTGRLHGVRLRHGSAEWYRNRWVRSKEVAEAFGEPWTGGSDDSAPNTHVLGHAGRVLATVEACLLPYAVTDMVGGLRTPRVERAIDIVDRPRPNATAITALLGWRTTSIRSSTSTRPERSNHRNARRNGKRAKWPRRSPPATDSQRPFR
jgi:Retinal pigment epithelial membrane protein